MMNSINKKSFFLKKTLLTLLCTFVFLFACLFVFKNQLLTFGVNYLFASFFPKGSGHELTYKKIDYSRGKVTISGIHLKEQGCEVSLDQLEFEAKFAHKGWRFEPKLVLVHPQIHIFSETTKSNSLKMLGALIPRDNFGLKLDIHHGVLQIHSNRFYFGFQSNLLPHQIGKFLISHDPGLIDHPFFIANFEMKENQLLSEIQVNEVQFQGLLQVLTFFYPKIPSEWKNFQGQVKLKATSLINLSGNIEELVCDFQTQNLEIHQPENELHAKAKAFGGNIHYPVGTPTQNNHLPFWKQIDGELTLEKAEVMISLDKKKVDSSLLKISELNALLSLSSKEDPTITLQGNLESLSEKLKFNVIGKGAAHEDETFWLDLNCQMISKKSQKECETLVSICRPDKGNFVIQGQLKNASPIQIKMVQELLKQDFPNICNVNVVDGNVQAKVMGWMEKSHLSRIEIQDFLAENLKLSFVNEKTEMQLQKVQGEAKFLKFQPYAQAEINVVSQLPVAQFAKLFSQKIENSYAPSSLMAFVFSAIKMKQGNSEVSGSLEFKRAEEFICDPLQFGFEVPSNSLFEMKEIKNGWLRSARLTADLYQPIVQSYLSGISAQGDVDLFGTFDATNLELSLQTDQFLINHPKFSLRTSSIGEKDPMLLKTKDRAKFAWDFVQNHLEIKTFLKQALMQDKKLGVALTDLSAEVSLKANLEGSTIEAVVHQANINHSGEDLLKDCSFQFYLDEKKTEVGLEKFQGKLAHLKENYLIQIPAMNLKDQKWNFESKLMHSSDFLVKLKGNANENFSQIIFSATLSESLPLSGNFEAKIENNFSKGASQIYLQGSDSFFLGNKVAEFALHLNRKKEKWKIDSLKMDDWQVKALMVEKDKHISIPQFELLSKNFLIQGMGDFTFELLKDPHYMLTSNLGLNIEMSHPIAFAARSNQMMKMAYSSELGLVLSDVDFSIGNSKVFIDHLEYLQKNKKLFLRQCKFLLFPAFASTIFGTKIPLMQKMENSPFLEGELNVQYEKDTVKAKGNLSRCSFLESKDLELALEMGAHSKNKLRKGKAVLCNSSENETLTLDFDVNEQFEPFLEKISGKVDAVQLSVQKKENPSDASFILFAGSVSGDLKKLAPLFSDEFKEGTKNWDFGKSFEMQGNFLLPKEANNGLEFVGKLKGENCGIFDYQFQEFAADAKLWGHHIFLENIQIKKDAGQMNLKQMTMLKTQNKPYWSFAIPELQFHNWVPELFQDKERSLLIKQGHLFDFQGKVGDPLSFRGHGNLQFISKGDKSFLVFDEKKLSFLGIDPSFLASLSGELTYEVKEGKCYLVDLRKAYSCKQRFEFFFPPASMDSYIGLNGNLFIDVKMKQHSEKNKAAQLSTISFRGTWDIPDIHLR